MNTTKREWYDFGITAFVAVFQIFIIVNIFCIKGSLLLVTVDLLFNAFLIFMLIVPSFAYAIWQDDLIKNFGPPKQEEAEEWYKYGKICMRAKSLHNHFIEVKTILALVFTLLSIFDFSSLIKAHNLMILIAVLWHIRKVILTKTE